MSDDAERRGLGAMVASSDPDFVRKSRRSKLVEWVRGTEGRHDLLAEMLPFAVGIHMAEIDREGGEISEWDLEYLERTGWALSSQADYLLFERRKPGWEDVAWEGKTRRTRQYGTAELFNMLARSTAIMAFFPGGLTVFGTHYEGRPRAKPEEG